MMNGVIVLPWTMTGGWMTIHVLKNKMQRNSSCVENKF